MYSGFCSIVWPGTCSGSEYLSPIPYGNQTEEEALFFEDGFKGVRGYLTEGHYLVFEANGYALSNPGSGRQFTTTKATAAHDDIHQRWVLHDLAEEGTTFRVTSALDGKYLSQSSSLSQLESGAEVYNITYLGNRGYALQEQNGLYLNIQPSGRLALDKEPVGYQLYSVTYHS